ncbi:response regulator [Aurantimonas sp. A2-1-M11]|uniref:response regulator transcription factor n=1 Tax=Aurantimonas sp. A2-1-M11 TaxID=3113712 RepID=UPI002F92BC09
MREIKASARMPGLLDGWGTARAVTECGAGAPDMKREKRLILLVDDDLAVRESLKFALELDDLSVSLCGTGEELLLHGELGSACCLVLDYQMPGMDGLDVLDALRAKGLTVPVILITGYATETLRRRADKAGVMRLLEKPLVDSALLDSIRQAIRLGNGGGTRAH